MAEPEKYAFSFSHAIIKANDRQFTGIKAIQFAQDVDREVTYGTSRKPQKRAAGLLRKGEGTITFSDVEEAMQFLASLGDDSSLATFSVDCTLSNEAAGLVRTFECVSCSLAGFSANFESGAEALSLEVPFDFMILKVDGKEFAR